MKTATLSLLVFPLYSSSRGVMARARAEASSKISRTGDEMSRHGRRNATWGRSKAAMLPLRFQRDTQETLGVVVRLCRLITTGK